MRRLTSTGPGWVRPLLAIAFVTVGVAAPAWAWDGATPPPQAVNPSGIAIGAPLGGQSFTGLPMWLDDAGRAIVLARSGQVLSAEPPRCWKLAKPKDQDLGPLVEPSVALDGLGRWRIAARPGRATVLALALRPAAGAPATLGTVELFEAACGVPAKLVATVAAPPATPIQTKASATDSAPLPLAAQGAVYMVHGALVRLDIAAATPAWQVVVTPEALRAQLGLPATTTVKLTAVGLTADDRPWLTYATSQPAAGVVEVQADLSVKPVFGPDPRVHALPWVHAAPQLGGMVLGPTQVHLEPVGSYLALALLPAAPPWQWPTRAPPWPSARYTIGADATGLGDHGFVGAFDGSLAVRAAPQSARDPQTQRALVHNDILPIAVLAGRADFDRDGLTASGEVALGLSDFRADSDGDGFGDGSEVGLLKTDPSSASSHPALPAATPGVSYGPSLLIGDGVPLRHLATKDFPSAIRHLASTWLFTPSFSTACPVAGKTDLTAPVGLLGAEGKVACHAWSKSVPIGAVASPSGKYVFSFAEEQRLGGGTVRVGVRRTDTTTWASDALAAVPDLAKFGNALYPVADDVVLLVRDAREVWRLDGASFQRVLAAGAAGCPVAAPAAAPAGCADGDGQGDMRPVGFDAAVGAWVFAFTRPIGAEYWGVSAHGVGMVTHSFELADGLDVENMQPLPAGGLLLQAGQSLASTGNKRGTFLVPSLFSPAGWGAVPQPSAYGKAGPWFFRGLYGVGYEHYRRENSPPGCLPKAPCEFSFALPIIDIIVANPTEWVPVPAALEAGEIVFASQRWYTRIQATFREGDGVYRAPSDSWRLGRISRLGAVVAWLDAAQFGAAVQDAAGAAALAALPLGPVSAIAAAPDGKRLCVAEGLGGAYKIDAPLPPPAAGAGRVWEIALDAGNVKEIKLIDPGPGRIGCAYDAAGQLARLHAAPAAIHVGDAVLAGDPSAKAAGLLRAGGQWLVRGQSVDAGAKVEATPAYCVASDGTRTPTGLAMIGAAEVPAGVAYIDTAGEAWVGRDPCAPASGFPQERLDSDLWRRWYIEHDWSNRGDLQVAAAALAMRPDGSVAVAPGTLDVFGELHLFRLEPTYAPREKERIEAHDAFRKATSRMGLLSHWAVAVSAMATLPGADASADWGRFAADPPAVWQAPGGPADTTGAGAPKAADEAAEDGGCGSGRRRAAGRDLGAWAAALLVLAASRRRRRTAPAG